MHKYYQARGEIRYDARLYHYPHILPIIIEIIFASIHPSPLWMGKIKTRFFFLSKIIVDYYFDNLNGVTGYVTTYGFNDILSIFMLCRAISVLRIFMTNSNYFGNSAKRIW